MIFINGRTKSKMTTMEQKLYCTYNQKLENPECKGCVFEGLNCKFLNKEADAHKTIEKWRHDSLMGIMTARLKNKDHLGQSKDNVPTETKTVVNYVDIEQENKQEKKSESDWETLWYVYFGAFLSSLILVFIIQLCAIMTAWFFDVLGWFLGVRGSAWAETAEDSFFYTTDMQAYIYGVVLMQLFAVWVFGGEGNKWANVIRGIVTTYFIIASIAMPHLFLSVTVGPLFIWFCIRFVATK